MGIEPVIFDKTDVLAGQWATVLHSNGDTRITLAIDRKKLLYH